MAKIKFSKDDLNYFRLHMGGGEMVRHSVSTQYQWLKFTFPGKTEIHK
jgi:hypothetical protein